MNYHIFIDFDGTITRQDSLVYLLDKYTGTEWRKIEDQVTNHTIDEKVALQKEFDLLNISLKTALDDLAGFPIDPYFKEFITYCDAQKMRVTILSGGIDYFIRTILENHGLSKLQFFANSVKIQNNQWKIVPAASPKIKNKCNHCKTYWVRNSIQNNTQTIYIGDGNTDRCPAEKANIRFAKNELAEYFESRRIQYYKYDNFAEILLRLKKILS